VTKQVFKHFLLAGNQPGNYAAAENNVRGLIVSFGISNPPQQALLDVLKTIESTHDAHQELRQRSEG
jgi:hypothetical protein